MRTLCVSEADYQLMLDIARVVCPCPSVRTSMGLRERNLLRRYGQMMGKWQRKEAKEHSKTK
ncbi:MAG: hypothetical protein LIO91_03515 [Bacteroidales bacterium]|nr:hypothetical protein [Bacteroidales bacterium]